MDEVEDASRGIIVGSAKKKKTRRTKKKKKRRFPAAHVATPDARAFPEAHARGLGPRLYVCGDEALNGTRVRVALLPTGAFPNGHAFFVSRAYARGGGVESSSGGKRLLRRPPGFGTTRGRVRRAQHVPVLGRGGEGGAVPRERVVGRRRRRVLRRRGEGGEGGDERGNHTTGARRSGRGRRRGERRRRSGVRDYSFFRDFFEEGSRKGRLEEGSFFGASVRHPRASARPRAVAGDAEGRGSLAPPRADSVPGGSRARRLGARRRDEARVGNAPARLRATGGSTSSPTARRGTSSCRSCARSITSSSCSRWTRSTLSTGTARSSPTAEGF